MKKDMRTWILNDFEETALANGAKMIKVEDIVYDEGMSFRTRMEEDPTTFQGLVDNIKAIGGIVQPITVMEINGKYALMHGYRRINAIKEINKHGGNIIEVIAKVK